MKHIFTRAALLLAAVATTAAFTACDDNEGDGDKKFSELQGSYVPTYVVKNNEAGTPNNVYLTITPTWVDEANIPTVDGSIMDPGMAGWPIPLSTVVEFMQGIASNFVQKGLVCLELKNDGTFGAQYHEVVSSGDVMNDMLAPVFEEAVSAFPGGADDALPADALRYYTQDGKIFFGVSKTFLNALDPSLCSTIDGLLKLYPSLPIVSTEALYALPLKYTLTGTTLKVSLDRATLVPVADLLASLGEGEVVVGGIDVGDIVGKLVSGTSELEIAIHLQAAL